MSRDRLPTAVAADEDIRPPFLPAPIFTIADAFDRASTSHNRRVVNDVHFIVILSKGSEFHLARFPPRKALSSCRQAPVRVRRHELRCQNAVKCGRIVLRVRLFPIMFQLNECLFDIRSLRGEACSEAEEYS